MMHNALHSAYNPRAQHITAAAVRYRDGNVVIDVIGNALAHPRSSSTNLVDSIVNNLVNNLVDNSLVDNAPWIAGCFRMEVSSPIIVSSASAGFATRA